MAILGGLELIIAKPLAAGLAKLFSAKVAAGLAAGSAIVIKTHLLTKGVEWANKEFGVNLSASMLETGMSIIENLSHLRAMQQLEKV